MGLPGLAQEAGCSQRAARATRQQGADHLAQIARADLTRMPVRCGDVGVLCALAEVCCTLEDREGAAWLYSHLAPFAARNAVSPNFEILGAVAHFLGLLARFLGEKHAALAPPALSPTWT